MTQDLFANLGPIAWYRRSTTMQHKVAEAKESALAFTTKQSYLDWVAAWKARYREMTVAAREGSTRWSRDERWAMLELRREGKVRSWAMKQARQATEAAAR